MNVDKNSLIVEYIVLMIQFLLQMFLYFSEHGLATCSADHLVILWKDGERESRLRSLLLFHKLEQSEDLQLRI